jgi:hypothetical protein
MEIIYHWIIFSNVIRVDCLTTCPDVMDVFIGTVEYIGARTAGTLAPQPFPILCATLCLSIQQPFA